MPPKKKSPKAACAVCAICSTEVENGKDASLDCQSCSQKFHRYCAGVALAEHKTYANGSPYECFHCFKVHKESTVTELKDCIEALKAEILELRSTVQELSNKVEAVAAEKRKTDLSWSQVVRRGKQRQETARSDTHPAKQTAAPGQVGSLHPIESRTRKPANKRKSLKAEGARKIWGTLKTTTSIAVRNTISSLTTIPSSKLQIKRKYKSRRINPDTVTLKWWFVIRGEESVLQELEGEWSAVAMQTAWKLEPVYIYEENPTPGNSQTARDDRPTTQATEENEQQPPNPMALSNSYHTDAPLEDFTTPAPLDTTPSTPAPLDTTPTTPAPLDTTPTTPAPLVTRPLQIAGDQ